MAAPRKTSESRRIQRPPATTPQAQEDRMVSLAINQVERQLEDGIASSAVLIHFLKLGTEREKLEREKLKHENDLLRARTDNIEASARSEEMMAKAINAFRGYAGQEVDEYED